MSKREEAMSLAVELFWAESQGEVEELVNLIIDAAKEELRAEMATTVLGPSEDERVEDLPDEG